MSQGSIKATLAEATAAELLKMTTEALDNVYTALKGQLGAYHDCRTYAAALVKLALSQYHPTAETIRQQPQIFDPAIREFVKIVIGMLPQQLLNALYASNEDDFHSVIVGWKNEVSISEYFSLVMSA